MTASRCLVTHATERRPTLPPVRRLTPVFTRKTDLPVDSLVRKATDEDLDAVLELQQMTMASTQRATRETLQAYLQASPETFLVLHERDSDRCIGYAIANIWGFRRSVSASQFNPNGDVLALRDEEGTEIQIAAVVIDPGHQGRGLGSLLFSRVIDTCRQRYPKCRTAVMLVERGATASRQMAAKRRFLVVDHWSNLWQGAEGKPVSAVLMRKHFGPVD